MTELSFAQTFLAALSTRPIKFPPDYVSDPKTLEIKGSYTLPRMPHPMQPPSTSSKKNPGSTPSLKIALKSLRNPPFALSLSSESPLTSIHELKATVVKELGSTAKLENIRILYKKKPCSDSKSVKEIVGDVDMGDEVEFTVMVIGGFDKSPVSQQGANPGIISQRPSGEEVLTSEEFWGDLKGFLLQRVRDEEKAVEALNAFRDGWSKRKTS